MSDEREKAKLEEDSQKSDSRIDDQPTQEIGGPKGPEPTRYGDWERAGRCIDF
jgi:hypothetical protein